MRRKQIPLYQLVSSRSNPRRVKPDREAHARLVASMRTFGFFSSLVVRPTDQSDSFAVVAGSRRLAALKEVHRGADDVQVPCIVLNGEADRAEAMSLAENFAREPMHPLDEAEAFAKLATMDGKGPDAIAAEFGVTGHYVRQRMKLSALAPVVKAAYRAGSIDTGTAEAFSAVPEDRQAQVWEELGGQPRHAQHVRNVISHGWIDAKHALFDVASLPENLVTRDLFGNQLLVERAAFMAAQMGALQAERVNLTEDGWSEVVVGSREEVQGQLMPLAPAQRAFDPKTARKLTKLAERRATLEQQLEGLDEHDEAALAKLGDRLDALQEAEAKLADAAPEHYAEETKAAGTAFLILNADGTVRREYRVPRQRHASAHVGGNNTSSDGPAAPPAPPTSADLSERQVAAVYTHHTLAVREAVLGDDKARRRVLALLLHDKVRSEGLSVRHEANGVTLEATVTEGFSSPVYDRLAEKRRKLDPLAGIAYVSEEDAYAKLAGLSAPKLDALIDLLVVEALTCHAARRTALIHTLAGELKVDFRRDWRPDAVWLAGFKKIQLSHLLSELYGPVYDPSRERRKKSELVAVLAKLFTDAAEGTLVDQELAGRANRWLPANLRPTESVEA